MAGVATQNLWLGRSLTGRHSQVNTLKAASQASQSSLPRRNERGGDTGQIKWDLGLGGR
jgi:hypothetical protein